MMDMNTLENRYILVRGLKNINNKAFKSFIKEQCYSLFGLSKADWTEDCYNKYNLSQIDIAFYITPLINALIRVGTQADKTSLFEAFINKIDLTTFSTEDEFFDRAIKNCTNAKSKQTRLRDKAVELLDIQIIEHGMENDKILILNADDLDVPHTITGLCAMNIAAKYNKPTLLGRVNIYGEMKGSLRGRENGPIKDLSEFLLNSNCMEYVQGRIGGP